MTLTDCGTVPQGQQQRATGRDRPGQRSWKLGYQVVALVELLLPLAAAGASTTVTRESRHISGNKPQLTGDWLPATRTVTHLGSWRALVLSFEG